MLSITCCFLTPYFLIKIWALKILIYDNTWLPYIYTYTFYRPRLYNTAVVSMNFVHENNAVLSCVNNEQINEPVLESNLCTCAMARRRLSDASRWQIIGMSNAGLSGREISRRLGYSQSVICSLLNKFQQTNHVQDRARSWRPRKTSWREDGALLRLVRRFPFLTSTIVKQRWLQNRTLSTRTVRNTLRASSYRARRPIRWPMLTPGQKAPRLYWCQQRRIWNIRSWRKIRLSDESRFLLHMTDCRVRVWRQRNTAYSQRHIQETVPFSGGSIMVRECVSHDCKLDLVTVQGTLSGQKYQTDILETVVIPHCDDHPLLTRPVFMDDNARPHSITCSDWMFASKCDFNTSVACSQSWFESSWTFAGHSGPENSWNRSSSADTTWTWGCIASGMAATLSSGYNAWSRVWGGVLMLPL